MGFYPLNILPKIENGKGLKKKVKNLKGTRLSMELLQNP